jgi:hypothetical protein
VVLDLFLGSRSTLIAAERTGRICYAMEQEPRYVDLAVRRWESFAGTKACEREQGGAKGNDVTDALAAKPQAVLATQRTVARQVRR